MRVRSAAGAQALAARYAAAAAKPPAFAEVAIGVVYHVASFGFTMAKKKWASSSTAAHPKSRLLDHLACAGGGHLATVQVLDGMQHACMPRFTQAPPSLPATLQAGGP
jgi:hypothetical protein